MSAADTSLGQPPQEPQQPKLSAMERVTNTFTAPSKTFTDLRHNANWFAPWLVMAVVSIIFVTAVGKKITWEQVVENKMASMTEKEKARAEQAPPEARAQQAKFMLISFKYFSYAFPVLFLAGIAVACAIYLAIYNFALGTDVKYKTAFAILIFASLPNIVRSVLAIITVFVISDPSTFNFENPVATNPGFLVSEASNPALYSLLSKIDVIGLWSTFLIGVGFACNSKLKRSTSIGVAFGIYAGFALLAVGFNLLFR
jgi:hypothetical protein